MAVLRRRFRVREKEKEREYNVHTADQAESSQRKKKEPTSTASSARKNISSITASYCKSNTLRQPVTQYQRKIRRKRKRKKRKRESGVYRIQHPRSACMHYACPANVFSVGIYRVRNYRFRGRSS